MRLRFASIFGTFVMLMLMLTPASAAILPPITLPPVTLPGVTVTLPGVTVTASGRTVTAPGGTSTVTATVPGPARTIVVTETAPAVPNPVSTDSIPAAPRTVTVTENAGGTQTTKTVSSGQVVTQGGTLMPSTQTVTATKIVVESGDDRIVRTTVPVATTISLVLFILGGIVALVALAFMYRLGVNDGDTRAAKVMKSITAQARQR